MRGSDVAYALNLELQFGYESANGSLLHPEGKLEDVKTETRTDVRGFARQGPT